MIARLRGRPVANTPDGLVVDVGGVGYLVAATPSAVRKADGANEVALHTYLHVREDALQLYGFAEAAERELFVQLLSVNGVGPKVALAIVSGSPARVCHHPWSMALRRPPLSWTMPYPHEAVPGSMPMTFTQPR